MRPLREIDLAELRTENCRELLEYWESKKTEPEPPLRRDLDPLIDKPHLASSLFIEQSVDGGRDFRTRLVGTKIVELFGSDATGKLVGEVWCEEESEALVALFAKCVNTRQPVAFEDSYAGIGKEWIEWEALLTPLRVDNAEIKQVIGCVGWLAPDTLVKQERAERHRQRS